MSDVSTSGLVQAVGDMLYEWGLVDEHWATVAMERGEQVQLFRQYYEGEHRAKLKGEMKDMLRISGDVLDQFNANYCGLVVDTISNRLKVDGIEIIDPTPNPSRSNGGESSENGDTVVGAVEDWEADLLRVNRFDGLQNDVHHACVRDGDAFVFVDVGDVLPELVLEEAFDSHEGMMVVYDKLGRSIVCAVKVWESNYRNDSFRVNIYLGDGYHRFSYGGEGGNLTYLAEDEGALDNPLGVVPIVHFKFGAKGRMRMGRSALMDVIPLQDSFNRELTSMVMTAELSAFQIRTARGFVPPEGVRPGMWITFGADVDDPSLLSAMGADVMEQAQLNQFIDAMNFLVERISDVGRCPLPNLGGATESGESRKQREALLVAVVESFTVKAGNAWEDVIQLAYDVYTLYVDNLPMVDGFNARWASSVVMDDEAVRKNSEHLHKMGYEREALRVLGYDEAQVEKLMSEKLADSSASAVNGVGLQSLADGLGALV